MELRFVARTANDSRVLISRYDSTLLTWQARVCGMHYGKASYQVVNRLVHANSYTVSIYSVFSSLT